MANDDFFQLDFDGLKEQVNELVKKLDRMDSDVAIGARDAAKEAAEAIASEQKRLLSQAHFKNGKADLAALIKIKEKTGGKYYRLAVGYDSEAIKAHPELLVIEFGRPGKSARRMKSTDSMGRRKGEFPPQTPHILPGFQTGKEKAARIFREKLLEIARRDWNNGGN